MSRLQRLEFRYLTPEELAEQEAPRCPSRPGPYSQAQCEFREGHVTPADEGHQNFHAGRTRAGYWKTWTTELVP